VKEKYSKTKKTVTKHDLGEKHAPLTFLQ